MSITKPLVQVVVGYPKDYISTIELVGKKRKLWCVTAHMDEKRMQVIPCKDKAQALQYWTFKGLFHKNPYSETIYCLLLDYHAAGGGIGFWGVGSIGLVGSSIYMGEYEEYRNTPEKAYNDFVKRVLCP
jgi:hypothetical protein